MRRDGRVSGLPDRPLIMLVTDRRRSGEPELLRSVEAAADAGVELVQVRERGMEDRDLLELVVRVTRSAGERTGVVINDRVDVALAAATQGVHLPGSGLAAAAVRRIVPASFLVGRSVHSVEEAREAERGGGCDYLVFGTVFATASKPAGHVPAGLESLARVCAAVALPVLAIGGITVERAADVARAGAAGIAGIGLFARPDAVAAEVAGLRQAFAGARK